MPFIVRNSSASPFHLLDDFVDLIFAGSEHVDLEAVFQEDQLYLSSVSPHALYLAINNGDLIRRTDADDADIAAIYAFDDAIWRWSPTRKQKDALKGTWGDPSDTNRYVTKEDPLYHFSNHLPSTGSDALPTGIAVDIASTNASGSANNFSRSDHTHRGIRSVKAGVAGSEVFGDVVFISGSGMTITNGSAGNFTFSASGSGVDYGASASTITPDAIATGGSDPAVSRSDHIHAITADVAVNIGTANSEGSSSGFSRADHVHQGLHSITVSSGSVRYGDIILTAGSGISISDSGGNYTFSSTSVVSFGLPVTLNPDQTNASGVASTAARSDHVHNVPADAPVNIGAVNTEGSSISFARADHIHNLLAGNGVVNTSGSLSLSFGNPVTLNPDVANTAGSLSTVARADHIHNVPADTAVSLDASSTSTEGASNSFARANHTHAIASGIAVSQTPDQTNASGTSVNFSRADHIHNIPAAAPVNIGTANSKGTAASFALSDHVHNLPISSGLVFTSGSLNVSWGTPVAQIPDQANASGSASTAARSDHVHNIGADTPVNIGSANTEGTSTSFARADHVHNLLAGTGIVNTSGSLSLSFGTPVTLNPDVANTAGSLNTVARADHIHNVPADVVVNIGAANAEGTSTSFARADHIHNLLAGNGVVNTSGSLSLSFGTPVSQTPDQANASGSATTAARSDHVHNIGADVPVNIGSSNTEGTSTSFARADHVHNLLAGNGVVNTSGSLSLSFGTPVTLNPDVTNTAGSLATVARADHIHNVPADTAVGLNAGSASTEGTSASFARADHTHAIASGIVVTQTPDQTNASGTSTSFARADHVHNIPTGIAVSIAATNASGTAASFARADHVHQGVHSVTLSGGTTRYNDITITQGSGLTITDTSGNYSFSANTVIGSGLKIKAGTVASGSFSGNPKKATVTFSGAFASTAYAITITGADNRNWTYETKASGSFVINANANAALTGEVSWIAVFGGESN